MKPDDIEIYIADADLPAVSRWLETVGTLAPWQGRASTTRLQTGKTSIPVYWYAQTVREWNGLLFASPETP